MGLLGKGEMHRSRGSLARKPAIENHLEKLGANGRRVSKCILYFVDRTSRRNSC
jgi:hypothetical protein